MASTYTDGLAVEIIGSGDKAGSWGDVTNNNIRAIEEGISRYAEIDVVAADASILNIPDGQTAYTDDSKGRSAVIKWTGAPTSNLHVVTLQVGGVGATQARFTAINGLDDPGVLRITCAIGTNVEIPNGYSANVHIEIDASGTALGVVNSLSSLSIDKLALGNQEVISNTVDDRVDIVSSTLQVGAGVDGSDTIIQAAAGGANAGRDLVIRNNALGSAGSIRFNDAGSGPIEITPGGTGSVIMPKVTISDGTIAGTVITNSSIGSSLPSTGAFTSLGATGTSTLAAINASGNIATSGSTTITAANGLIATAGGLNVTGGVTVNSGATNLTGGGITNAGSISGAGAISAVSLTTSSGDITANSGDIQVTAGNLGVGVAASGTGTGKISADGLITTSGGISTTGSSTIVSAGRITSSGGLTAGGTITGVSSITASGNILTSANVNGQLITAATGLRATTGGLVISSGGIISAGSVNLNSGGISAAGTISGAGSITASGNIVSDSGNIQASNGNLGVGRSAGAAGPGNISATGLISTTGNIETTGSGTISSAGRVTSGNGLTTGGTITGATDITASGTVTAATGFVAQTSGLLINAGGLTVNGSTDLNNGGIVGVGPISSVTTVNANGNAVTFGGQVNAGSVDSTGTITSGGLTLDAGTLNVGNRNISNVGTIAGVTTINANGDAATFGGNISTTGVSTINSAGRMISGGGLTAGGTITGATTIAASGNISGGTISGSGSGLTGTAANLTAGNVTDNANLTGDVTSVGNQTSIALGAIINTDINASAGIAYSKMAAANTAPTWDQDTTGTAANATNAVTAATVTINAALTGDIQTTTGNATQIASGVIINDDVNASAAIAYSKLNVPNGSIDGLKLNTTNVPTADYVLTANNSGSMTWEASLVGDITRVNGGTGITATNPDGPIPILNIDAAQPTITSLGTLTDLTVTNPIAGSVTGTATTAGKITSITNNDIVQLLDTQTLENKTLTSPTVASPDITGTATADIIEAGAGSNITGATYISSEGGFRSSTYTSRSVNSAMTISPNGTGKLNLTASGVASGSSSIDINSLNNPVLISAGSASATAASSLILLRTFGSGVSDTKFVINSTGSYVATAPSGNRYLSMSSFGGEAASGFRNDTSGNMEIRSKNLALGATGADGWGRAYHSGMVSGDGSYFEMTGGSVQGNLDGGPLAHSLGATPRLITVRAVCLFSQWGYTPGDTVYLSSGSQGASSRGISVSADATNLYWSIGSGSIYVIERDTFGQNSEQVLGTSNWELQIMAWK